MKLLKAIALPGALVLVCLFLFTTYQLKENQTAIVVRLGKYSRTVDKPGLHFRMPFLESVVSFEKWLRDYDAKPRDILTRDKKNLVVDNFAKWRVLDPLKFYQTVKNEAGAMQRLDDIIYSELRQSLGNFTLEEIVRIERKTIMDEVTKRSDEQARRYGIQIVDVRIRQADLPKQNEASVFQRMQTEREREAKLLRSEGEARARKIRAEADKEKQILLAEAERQAQETQGKADAEAIKIFADAYGRDPDFFRFFRSLEAYRKSLKTGTTYVLTPEMEMLQFLTNSKGRPAVAAPAQAEKPAPEAPEASRSPVPAPALPAATPAVPFVAPAVPAATPTQPAQLEPAVRPDGQP